MLHQKVVLEDPVIHILKGNSQFNEKREEKTHLTKLYISGDFHCLFQPSIRHHKGIQEERFLLLS
jgi:hypothetical protein